MTLGTIQILIILFINQLSVQSRPIFQNINLTAENQTLTNSAESAVKLSLLEHELDKDGNIVLTSSIEQGQLPLPFHNVNLTKDDSLDFVLNNGLIVSDKPPARKDVKNSDHYLQGESSVTSLEEISMSHFEQENHEETPLKEVENISKTKDDFDSQKLSSESSEYFFSTTQSNNLITTQFRNLSQKQEKERGQGDNFSEIFGLNSTTEEQFSSFEKGSDNILLQEHNETAKVVHEIKPHTMDKYDISSSASFPMENLLGPNALKNQSRDREISTNNQTRLENNAKPINEYKITIKALNSSGFSQTSNLAESESIEIVLKEATSLNKNPEEHISNHQTESGVTHNISEGKENLASEQNENVPSDLKEKINLAIKENKNISTLWQSSASINNTEPVSIVLENFDRSENDLKKTLKEITNLSERQKENTENLGQDFSSIPLEILKPSNNLREPQLLNLPSKSDETVNKTQADNTDANKQTLKTLNSFKKSQTFNQQDTAEVKESSDFNGTQEKFLVPTTILDQVDTSWEADKFSQDLSDSFKTQQNFNKTENEPDEHEVFTENKKLDDQEVKINSTFFTTNYLTPATFSPFEEFETFTGAEDPGKTFFPLEVTTSTPESFKGIQEASECHTKEGEELQSQLSEEKSASKLFTTNKPDRTLESVTNLKHPITPSSFVELFGDFTTSSSSTLELITDPTQIFETSYPITGGIIENQPQHFAEYSSISLEEDDNEFAPKPQISLEEYAVKQMNFILDHLLLETQKFVAEVLQATINSVFPRDRLKHYAEGVNLVLNPSVESEYSDEIVPTTGSQDEIYEQMVDKLNFLKNKPSKYLQKQIPPEWLNQFLAKRTELVVWLDKAAEQMHKEFTNYITEIEDPIKYQYFNETFDDIYRATEIHHKLAFLADLVKIIKNKKQITFMDLYMQT